MWIRSAFWIGTPRDAAGFQAIVTGELMPGLRQMPGVRDAEALWPRRHEPGAPSMHCQMIVRFDDLAAIDRMLASPERAAMRARVLEVLADFDGILTHIDQEIV